MERSPLEATGPGFELEKLCAVQARTCAALRELAASVEPGMLEDDALESTRRKLQELGFEKSWHRPYVRFGPNTSLIYGKASTPGVRLRDDDIFFLDIGTVLEGYEGDAGDTFTVGTDAEMDRCAQAARTVWQRAKEAWREQRLSGPALYDFASRETARLGFSLNPDWAGHRVADFPHHAYYKGSLAKAELCPAPGIWILEIHLCHPSGAYGAFYEDSLR